MRFLFAIAVWYAVPPLIRFTEQPDPVGIAKIIDLTFLGDTSWMNLSRIILFIGLTGYVMNWFRAVSLLLVTSVFIAVYTLDNSQGSDHHHAQIIGLVLLVLSIAYSLKTIHHFFSNKSFNHTKFDNQTFHFAQQTIVATYLVSAITKLLTSGIGWIADSYRFPLQIRKAQQMQYYNQMEISPETATSFINQIPMWLESFLASSPKFSMLFVGSGLVLELFAFIALLGRRFNLAIGSLLILFHLTVSKAMNLSFDHNIELLFIFFVLPNLLFILFNLIKIHYPKLDDYLRRELSESARNTQFLWNMIPLKPLLSVLFLSFIIIKHNPVNPHKPYNPVSFSYTGANSNVKDDLKNAEFYPLSPFPMYSRYSASPFYVYLLDENENEFSIIETLKVQSSQLKKLYDGELRKVKKETGTPISKMSLAQKEQAGNNTLQTLQTTLTPQTIKTCGFKKIHLYEVVLTQGENGIHRSKTKVGTLNL